jgi:hypothetical protein
MEKFTFRIREIFKLKMVVIALRTIGPLTKARHENPTKQPWRALNPRLQPWRAMVSMIKSTTVQPSKSKQQSTDRNFLR